jgi:hypothetical protein
VTRDVPEGAIVTTATGALGAALKQMALEAGLTTDELLAEMARAFLEGEAAPPGA